jgi:magnesium transporter
MKVPQAALEAAIPPHRCDDVLVIQGMGRYRDGAPVSVQSSTNLILSDDALDEGLDKRLAQLCDGLGSTANEFVWLGLVEPSRGEIDAAAKIFDLDPLEIDDAMNVRQRAKASFRKDSAFVVLKTLQYVEETSDVETSQISIFIGRTYVLTVRLGQTVSLVDVRRRLEREQHLLQHGSVSVLYAVLDHVVDGYVHVGEELGRDVEQAEELIFSADRTDDSPVLYQLKRENLEMRRAVLPLTPNVTQFVRDPNPLVPEALKPYFVDVVDHLLRVADQVDTYDQLLVTMLEAARSQQDLRMNNDMRAISAWVAMAAVPTMIAGIYGMNFDVLPELHWQYGYYVVLGIMATACGLLYRAFKKSGWL